MEPTCWACFQYRAQAYRLSFPSFHVPSGTPAKDSKWLWLSRSTLNLYYSSGRLSGGWEGVSLLPLSTVTSRVLPLSTVTPRFLPLSSLASYFSILSVRSPAMVA